MSLRPLFLIHRWAGILVGLMAFVWFASGIVVHWYAYVDATERQRLKSYGAPLTAAEIRSIRLPTVVQAGAPIVHTELHHIVRELVWLTETSQGDPVLLDARSGRRRSGVTPTEATQIAITLLGRPAPAADVRLITQPDVYYYEQSFQYEFSAAQRLPLPVYRVGFPGPHATAVYIDPATGLVTAVVGPRQRVTRLLGTLPHFLNPTPLHGHPMLHLLIMLGLLLGVLTSGVTGLIYGVWFLWWQRSRRPVDGERRRPLRRVLAEWHNWIGVVGGALVITWAVSGCLMLWYPEVTPDQREVARLDGSALRATDYRLLPDSAVRIAVRAGASPVVALQARVFLTRPVYDARHADGRSTLIDGVNGTVLSPLPDSLVRAVARAYVGREPEIRAVSYLMQYDAYYYDLHGRYRPLPVYRVDLAGRDVPSPLYIDALRGGLVGRVTGDYRTFRWYGSALHTMDFPALLSHPTAWHLVLVGLALVGAALSGSGLWLGFIHLRRARPTATGRA